MEKDEVLNIAGAIADDQAVDWSTESSRSGIEKRMLEALMLVQEVREANRRVLEPEPGFETTPQALRPSDSSEAPPGWRTLFGSPSRLAMTGAAVVLVVAAIWFV